MLTTLNKSRHRTPSLTVYMNIVERALSLIFLFAYIPSSNDISEEFWLEIVEHIHVSFGKVDSDREFSA